MKNGKLPRPNLQEDFDATRYLGDWYEIYRSKSIRFEKADATNIVARCGSDPKHPERITITNLQCIPKTGKVETITGYVVRRKPDGPASDLLVRINWILSGKYQVLETDYENYSVVYSSRSMFFGLFKKEYCWILARKKGLASADPELIDRLFQKIQNETGITRDEFQQTEQSA